MSSLLQDLSSNHLGFKGCQYVCDMLQNNTTLLKIDLSDNGFDDRDTVSLLEAFKVSYTRSRNEFLRERSSYRRFSWQLKLSQRSLEDHPVFNWQDSNPGPWDCAAHCHFSKSSWNVSSVSCPLKAMRKRLRKCLEVMKQYILSLFTVKFVQAQNTFRCQI